MLQYLYILWSGFSPAGIIENRIGNEVTTQVEALHRARILPIVQLKNGVLFGQLVYLVLECAYYTSHSCL